MRWWMAVVVALGTACGSDSVPSVPDADVVGFDCTAGGIFDLTGRFAVLGLLNVHIDASGLVQTDTTSELLLYLDTQHEGTALALTATLCDIQIPEVPISGQDMPIRFEVPQQTIASVAPVAGAAVLSSPSATCATFETDLFTIVMGARLEPVETAALPAADEFGSFRFCAPTAQTSCDLAIGLNCACDQEQDAAAGMTLRAFNVPIVELDQVYVTFRTQFRLLGVVLGSDDVVGTVEPSLAQGILGCRMARGEACGPDQVGAVQQLNPAITQQPGNPSTYRSVRIPADWTCADIAANKDLIFPL